MPTAIKTTLAVLSSIYNDGGVQLAVHIEGQGAVVVLLTAAQARAIASDILAAANLGELASCQVSRSN